MKDHLDAVGIFSRDETWMDRADDLHARIVGIEEFYLVGLISKDERARLLTEALENYLGEQEKV